MNKLTITLAFLATLFAAGMVWQYDRATDLKADLTERTQELKRSKAALVLVQKKVSAAQAAAADARHKLKEALDASPEFRDTAVPDPVYDSLCSTLRCN